MTLTLGTGVVWEVENTYEQFDRDHFTFTFTLLRDDLTTDEIVVTLMTPSALDTIIVQDNGKIVYSAINKYKSIASISRSFDPGVVAYPTITLSSVA